MQKINKFLFRYLGTFFMEKKNKEWVMSLGRTSFIILFILSLYMWAPFLGTGSLILPAGMLQFLMILATYNLGSKVTNIVEAYIKQKTISQKEQQK